MSTDAAPSPRLHRTVRDGDGPTIVLVHGFTQTSESWAPVVVELDRALAERGIARPRVVAIDAPGHGGSGSLRLDLTAGAQALAALGREEAPDAIWVGYSMGARLVLRFALDAPDLPSAVVLLGCTAGIDDAEERATRRRADEGLARDLERDGIEPFLDRWLAQPLFARLPADDADRAARRANRPGDLASSLRLAGTGTMDPPWWSELSRIRTPTLVCWGEEDAKFAHLGGRIAEAIGDAAETAAIADAGHAAHLEHPRRFAGVVADVVARRIRPGSTTPP